MQEIDPKIFEVIEGTRKAEPRPGIGANENNS